MANIQVAFTDPDTQAVLPAAYVLIKWVLIDADDQTIEVRWSIYASAAAHTAGARPVTTYAAHPPFASIMNGPVNIPVAVVAYSKTLPIFAGAIDVP